MLKKIALVCLIGMLALSINADGISPAEWTRHGNWLDGTYTTVVVIEGHQYIIARCARGICIIHAHSCPCMNKK